MSRCSNVLVTLVSGLTLALGACSGDTVESEGNGGSGGQVLDSAPGVDAPSEAAADAGGADVSPDVPEDVSADVSADVSVDQSVEETGLQDGEVLEGSLFDLNMPDVLLNDSGATLQGCYDCAVASCSAEMSACEEDDKCRTILLCLFEDQCFGGSSGIELSCGLGCAQKAGISSMNDPAVSIALSAGQCIADGCQEECGLPADGGLPFDGGVPDGF
ncbi:MAG: hypothetical protein ACOC1F_00045 [Myxococcota bacterium]